MQLQQRLPIDPAGNAIRVPAVASPTGEIVERVRDAVCPRVRAAELDFLRITAVLLVVIVHAAQIFSPFESWHVASPDTSIWLGLFTAFTASWLLPLLTLVAGASMWYAAQGRPLGAFTRSRVLRLLPPLVAGTLILVPPQVYLRRIYRGEFDGTFVQFYPRFFDGIFPDGNFSWGHLWFLAYLIVYIVAALPLLRFLSRPEGQAVLVRLGRWSRPRGALLLAALPLVASQLLLRAPFTQVTGALVDDWATHAWLFFAFIAGYVLYAEPALLRAVDRDWRLAILPGLLSATLAAGFVLPGDAYARLPSEPGLWYVLFWSGLSFGSWAWTLVALGAVRQYLRRSSPRMTRWGRAAYGIYVLHQTVVVAVAFHVVGLPLGVHTRFAIVALLSLAGTLALVALLRQVPEAGRWFGVA
jgi:glucans biosynthesis protein C